MLKSFATACSECTAEHENKAIYNTYYIVADLIDFSGDDWKEIKTQIEKRNIYIGKKILYWLKVGLLLALLRIS